MFQGQQIDFSEAPIIRVNSSDMSTKELEKFLLNENQYTWAKFM
jgi:hypothetical protein